MDAVLSDFVQVLRNAGVGVSVAEHLDALKAVAALGVDDPLLLKAALAACLVKNPSDRPIFDGCFHRFFRTIPDLAGPKALKAHSKTGPDELAPSTKRPLFANRAALAVSVAEAARRIRLPGAVPMLQRGLYVQAMLRRLEADHFHQDVDLLRSVGGSAAKGHELEQARKNLVDVVRSFVEARVVFDGAEALQGAPADAPWDAVRLSAWERQDVEAMHRLVAKMVRTLHARYGRRRKRARVGFLDFKASLRANLGTQGLIFDPRWKKKRPDRPHIIAVCDVSRSVRNVTRFFLFFLYNLHRSVSKIRTFVFCSNLVEVSNVFKKEPLEQALGRIETGRGLRLNMGLTDYGKAFEDFASHALKTVSRRTVLLVLGDARNNHDDPAAAAFERIRQRVRRLLWLNPEPPALWDTGDSVMRVYRPLCDAVLPCRTLRDLERLAELLNTHRKEVRSWWTMERSKALYRTR
uniref:VWA domain-containing protein n=1 Tax=Desulfacinum infernum TaxID=35837 RepID=A0A832EJ32_9BACT